jgi:hypothetical protein
MCGGAHGVNVQKAGGRGGGGGGTKDMNFKNRALSEVVLTKKIPWLNAERGFCGKLVVIK